MCEKYNEIIKGPQNLVRLSPFKELFEDFAKGQLYNKKVSVAPEKCGQSVKKIREILYSSLTSTGTYTSVLIAF
jgi:hypothetical protein